MLTSPYLRFMLVGCCCAMLIFGLSLMVAPPSSGGLWLAQWVVSLSIATFGVYRYDKAAAEGGGTRVPRLVLHLLSTLGGSPGAFIGMRWPSRHKTSKPGFQTIFWVIVACQAGLVALWLSVA